MLCSLTELRFDVVYGGRYEYGHDAGVPRTAAG